MPGLRHPPDRQRRRVLASLAAALPAMPVPAQPTDDLLAEVRLFFGTTRVLEPGSSPPRFGGVRDSLRLGTADITLPVGRHHAGRIERPALLARSHQSRLAEHVRIDQVTLCDPDAFFAAIETAQSKLTREASLFVHGYNVHFGSAALRAAQLWWDTQFGGLPLFYSWPSRGNTAGYFDDRRQIPLAQADLSGFLKRVASRVQFERLHVIAHSMGTHITTLALASLAQDPQWHGRVGELVLAAPDIPLGEAATLLAAVRGFARRVTMYVSAHDPAMKASRAANRQPSLGDIRQAPSVMPGIDTIDATHTDTHFLSHGYINKSREVIEDLGKIMRGDLDPEARGLQRVEASQRKWWTFTPG